MRRTALLAVTLLAGISATQARAESRWRAIVDADGSAPAAQAGLLPATPDDFAWARGVSQPTHAVGRFSRMPSAATRDALRKAGVETLGALGGTDFFVRIDPPFAGAAVVERLGLTRIERIRTEWKIDALLTGAAPEWAIVSADADPLIGVYVLLHDDIDFATDGAAALKPHIDTLRSRLVSINAVVVEMRQSKVAALAAEDAVAWVEAPLPEFSNLNDSNRHATQVDLLQEPPYGLTGAGVTVMVYDGGTALATHVDFDTRMTVLDDNSASFHATHVSATIGGAGVASDGLYRGMAPGVDIISYSFEAGGSGIGLFSDPGDIELDYGDGIMNGADLTNNSIGTNTARFWDCAITGNYGITSSVIDEVVRGSVSNGVPHRILWAGGNERGVSRCGDLYYTTAPPSGAKNHITIGALNSNDDSMTDFSSWGPTDDGRLKPDIAGPGCQSDEDEGVTSATTGANNRSLITLCGTSMSTPTVTGISALLLEELRTLRPLAADPRNSTLKILLAHNAADLGNIGPDYQFGYGAVRAKDTIDFLRAGVWREDSLGHGETIAYSLDVEPGEPIKVTIAWDDPAAIPNVIPSLVNDVDLLLIDPDGGEHFPWTLTPNSPDSPALRDKPDRLNNMEQVVVDNPIAGRWTVEVRGFNLPRGPQPFSIATGNALITHVAIKLIDAAPIVLTPGAPTVFEVEISPGEEGLVPGSAQLWFRYMGANFDSVPLTPIGGDRWLATLPPAVCDAAPEFYLTADGLISGRHALPRGAADEAWTATVGPFGQWLSDDMELPRGWTVGAPEDDATDGVWERVDPEPTAAQPASDFSPGGVLAWVTNGLAGSRDASHDVDAGQTTLTSPTFDLTGLVEPQIRYYLWYSNDLGLGAPDDAFVVDMSTDGGANWTNVETIGPANTPVGWSLRTINPHELAPGATQIVLRFIASDRGAGSIVEALVDDLSIVGIACGAALDDCDRNGVVDSDDLASGRGADNNDNGVLDACDGCVGDLTGDFTRDLSDLSLLLSTFGRCENIDPRADMNADGCVDVTDLAWLLSVFGTPCP